MIFIYKEIFINSLWHKMATFLKIRREQLKKGIIITILIAAGIVAASFLVYLIP